MIDKPKVVPIKPRVGGGTLPRLSGLPGKDTIRLVPPDYDDGLIIPPDALSEAEYRARVYAGKESVIAQSVPMARDWQPIDTAPKDGTHILGWLADLTEPDEFDKHQPAPWIVLRWDGRHWVEPHYDAFSYHPTKWMPLPEPPK